MNFLFIAAGGGAGACLRYLTSLVINKAVPGFPLGTLAVNSIGALGIGFLFAVFQAHAVPSALRLFLITGFLGGYTTFSTYSLETVQLLLDGTIRQGIINFLLNNALCFILALAGILLGRSVVKQ
jgi:CrcB protein